MNLKIISAGAGSGKTYSLTQEMARLLMPGENGSPSSINASGILATTFTNKAAAELKERVRVKLLEEGLSKEADDLGRAKIGTVHAVGVQLIKRFAFEAGVSPNADIIAEEDQKIIFNQSISTILSNEKIAVMENLSELLGFRKSSYAAKDWRSELKNITEIARANNLGPELLKKSRDYSIKSYFELFPETSQNSAEYFSNRLEFLLLDTIDALKEHPDGTKKKESLIAALFNLNKNLKLRGQLLWYEWQQIAKQCEDAPAKCRETVAELREFALEHNTHPDFHRDLRLYLSHIFDLAAEALEEYENYKKSRGLIDYTDMEVMILRLLDNPFVREVLTEELDLLLVDEFQDTNPIQLKIFLQLTKIAKQSIWVGDPKQSIYGFRGAAPELMEAVIESVGKENIQVLDKSWRSRQDLVHMVNGLFTKAFSKMPSERVALNMPKHLNKESEAAQLDLAIRHWVLSCSDDKPDNNWIANALAKACSELLESNDLMVRDKESEALRLLKPSDIAILCRSNKNCEAMAEALDKQGLKASMARSGLLQTAEASLLLACLKFILNDQDSLAVAEIMMLMTDSRLEDMILSRLDFLEKREDKYSNWTAELPIIESLSELRKQTQEMSASEILNLLIEKYNLRHFAAARGNAVQRIANLDAMRSLALQYEENCKRLNNAATLGGFLLWLDDLGRDNKDEQGFSSDDSAINVLTYHKSKGLEWPLVICFDLSNSLKERLYDVRIVSENNEVDLNDPLAGRLICYWINPYGDIEKHALAEAIENHPDRLKIKQEALEEEIRLLYVGLTRARDYLVLPVVPQHRGKNQGIDWLNRVFHNGNAELPAIDFMANVCLWPWLDSEIPVQVNNIEFPKLIEDRIGTNEKFYYIEPFSGEKNYASSFPDAPEKLIDNLAILLSEDSHYYRNPLLLPPDESFDSLGLVKMLQLHLNSSLKSGKAKNNPGSAEHLIRQFGMQHIIDAETVLRFSAQFETQLEKLYGDFTVEKNKTFYLKINAQTLSASVDLILETKDKTIFVFDCLLTLSEFRKRQKKILKRFSALYTIAKLAVSSKKDSAVLIHFPLEGLLMDAKFAE
jgi:ATP-dependent exoDNAse (exonuclease V) beta subunit